VIDLCHWCLQVALIVEDECLIGCDDVLVLVERVPTENWRQLFVAVEILRRELEPCVLFCRSFLFSRGKDEKK